MAKEQVIQILNRARARELQVCIQYMWQHYTAEGMESPAVMDIFKETAIAEMKHAETFGERIVYLGGTPTTQPNPVIKSDSLKQMVADDLKAENEAIEMYLEAVKICEQEADPVSRLLFEKILAEEEEHKDTFQLLLNQRGKA